MEYKYYSICEFRHGVYVSSRLLGKKIPIKIDDVEGYILMPKLHAYNTASIPSLINPYYKDADIDSWGSVTLSGWGRDMIVHPCIKAVMCVLLTDLHDNQSSYFNQQIENYISKFIKCIAGINPELIEWSSRNEESFVAPISLWANCGEDSEWIPTISIPFRSLRFQYNELEFPCIKDILRNIEAPISLQCELLINVKKCILDHKYRETILFSATIIEKTLRDEVVDYLVQNKTEKIITKYIISNIDGFQKIRKAIDDLGISSDKTRLNQIAKGSIYIRNRVIHGGYHPLKEEALKAYEDARYIIDYYKVNLFEKRSWTQILGQRSV